MPLDRHFLYGYTKLLSEEQEFDVEYPCWEVLVWEDLLSGSAGEEFEAALGVADVANADYAQDGVKAVHEDVAEERTLCKGSSLEIFLGRERRTESAYLDYSVSFD